MPPADPVDPGVGSDTTFHSDVHAFLDNRTRDVPLELQVNDGDIWNMLRMLTWRHIKGPRINV